MEDGGSLAKLSKILTRTGQSKEGCLSRSGPVKREFRGV